MQSGYGGYWGSSEVDGIRGRCDVLRGEYEEVVRGGNGVVEEKAWLIRALTNLFWEPTLDLKTLSYRAFTAEPLKAILGLQGPVWSLVHSLNNTRFFIDLTQCSFTQLLPALARMEGVSSVELLSIFFGSHLFGSTYSPTIVDPSDSLYFYLLQEYCSYFLPNSGYFSPAHQFPTCPGGAAEGSLSRWELLRTPLGLFKRSIYEESRSGAGEVRKSGSREKWPRPHSSSSSSSPSLSGRTEAFVSILCSLWLSPDSQEVLEIRVLAARFLVKQIHHFTYTQAPTDSALDELKEFVLPGILSRSLLPFLRHFFNHWPLDASFRPFLETWLSYIQPWRYADSGVFSVNDDRWRVFISNNIEFYTTLYTLVIERLSRMELRSAKNSILGVRLSKVFATQNGLVEEVEEIDAGRHPQPPVLPFINRISDACQDIMDETAQLRMEIADSNRVEGSSWLGWLSLSLSFSEPDQRVERVEGLKRLLSDIRFVRDSFARTYSLGLGELSERTPDRRQYCEDGEPDSYLDVSIGRRRLTPLGRTQVLSGRKFRFDSSAQAEADLDISDIHQDEIGFLVKLLYKMSGAVNRRLGSYCGSLYEAESVEGWLSRAVVRGPTRKAGYGSPDIRRRPVLLPARFSFRSLAKLRNLLFLALALSIFAISSLLPIPTPLKYIAAILFCLSFCWC